MNLYTQLKRLLPEPAVRVGRVVARNLDDDTSVVDTNVGQGQVQVSEGLSTGSRMVVRGASVEEGGTAATRSMVIESKVPESTVIEIVVGKVVGA